MSPHILIVFAGKTASERIRYHRSNKTCWFSFISLRTIPLLRDAIFNNVLIDGQIARAIRENTPAINLPCLAIIRLVIAIIL